RRIRHPRSTRRLRQPDDRADIVDGILFQPRLAGRFRHRDGAARPADRADHGLRAAATAPIRGTQLMRRGASSFNVIAVALGLAFLYLPIAVLVIYSFNASRLVTIWGGWSLRWYGELLRDAPMLDAASVSL